MNSSDAPEPDVPIDASAQVLRRAISNVESMLERLGGSPAGQCAVSAGPASAVEAPVEAAVDVTTDADRIRADAIREAARLLAVAEARAAAIVRAAYREAELVQRRAAGGQPDPAA